jgi:hypothetical protein
MRIPDSGHDGTSADGAAVHVTAPCVFVLRSPSPQRSVLLPIARPDYVGTEPEVNRNGTWS